jgi:hypothetical protein
MAMLKYETAELARSLRLLVAANADIGMRRADIKRVDTTLKIYFMIAFLGGTQKAHHMGEGRNPPYQFPDMT